MNLHNEIQNHISELQDLLTETDEQKLLNKARKQWGEDDSRYEVLEQFVTTSSSRGVSKSVKSPLHSFDKPAGGPNPESFDGPAAPPAPESGQNGDQNKLVK